MRYAAAILGLVFSTGAVPDTIADSDPQSLSRRSAHASASDTGEASTKLRTHKEGPDKQSIVPSAFNMQSTSASSADVSLGRFTSIQVNVDALGDNIIGDAANEPSIAVDPTDRARMAIGWRQFATITSSFRQAGIAHSTDAGQTWTVTGPIRPAEFASDPVLESDADGAFYYLSLQPNRGPGTFPCYMYASSDGGATWPQDVYAFGGDKAWFAIDKTGGVGRGNIYMSWNPGNTSGCCFPATFTRSTDGGLTWDTPLEQPAPTFLGTVTIAPDGAVYALGTPNPGADPFAVIRSSNAQDPLVTPTFDHSSVVDLDGTRTFGVGPNPGGALGQAWIAADHSIGPNHGNLYVVVNVERVSVSDPSDVMFARSTDRGVSWSAPIRLNDDLPGNGAWQWFATLSVAPNGRLDVIWNDTRNDATPQTPAFSELFYTFSLDGGLTWSSNEVASSPFDHGLGYPQQNKIGDYYDMESDNGGADLAWAATFNGEQDVYYLRVTPDCNSNGFGDEDDILALTSEDCNGNLIPDECEPIEDCNVNLIQDICDIAALTSEDCNTNWVPDECDPQHDCNANLVQDICDIAVGTSTDCNRNDVPDECEPDDDCNSNGALDECDIAPDGVSKDCNGNSIPDECDISSGFSQDQDMDGIPDECNGACCDCETCSEITESACAALDGEFHGVGVTCGSVTCIGAQINDVCTQAEILPSDPSLSRVFSNECADVDGPDIASCENGVQSFGSDLWYEYTTPCCGQLTVSLCDDTDYDAIIALYGGAEACSCSTGGDLSLQCGDDSCGPLAGPPTISHTVEADTCYLIRVGGWSGAEGNGTLNLTMTCQPDSDGDGLCAGVDNCPNDANRTQLDTDRDGVGDACDPCPNDPADDADGDSVCADVDNCPTLANQNQADADSNGIGDVCEPAIVYVDANATGANSGLTWADAFVDFQDALDLAPTLPSPVRPQVWVAGGTYLPSVEIVVGEPRTVTFALPAGLEIYGGFAGGEDLLEERDIATNASILSGDLAGDDGPFPGNNAENAFNVVRFDTDQNSSLLDGFTITRANANDPGGTFTFGGAVLFFDTNGGGTLRNCIITENEAILAAGIGMAGTGPFGTPQSEALVIDKCEICTNRAGSGTGLLIGAQRMVTVTNTLFQGNESLAAVGTGNGAAVLALFPVDFGVTFEGCAFRSNSADSDGGAIWADLGFRNMTVVNSTFFQNTAAEGGAIHNNNTVTGNAGTIRLYNSIVWGNSDDTGTGESSQLFNIGGTGLITPIACDIEGLTGLLGGGANIDSDPLFTNAPADLRVDTSSPVIDLGNNQFGSTTEDLAGQPRVVDLTCDGIARVDMGAYEVQAAEQCAPPLDIAGEPSSTSKSRYISFVPGNAGGQVAIRVLLIDPDGFPLFGGEARWVGPPAIFSEEDSSDPGRTFTAAPLQCDPHFQDWGSISLLHVYGAEVVPNSHYDVQAIRLACEAFAGCSGSYSPPLAVFTGKWGDAVAPFGGGAQPNFADVTAIVDKFKSFGSAPIMASADLAGSGNTGLPNIPNQTANFADISLDVDAFNGSNYPFTLAQCP